jgi:phosphoribosylaminoimidazolecarboxamide formyltransferase / IMP cyclohydrolase
VVAPRYTPEGLATLKGKSKDLRILEAQPRARGGRSYRQVGGGWLLQDADDMGPGDLELSVVSEKQPTPEQLRDLEFAWRCVKHVKSNAITLAKDGRLLGMGSGQPNRVKSVDIAMEKAGDEVRGAALASDAFFPFAWGDAVEQACKAGVGAIIHPGGSLRDQDGIDCCNQYGVVLVFTGVRHFRH